MGSGSKKLGSEQVASLPQFLLCISSYQYNFNFLILSGLEQLCLCSDAGKLHFFSLAVPGAEVLYFYYYNKNRGINYKNFYSKWKKNLRQ
jgi:hypothetical protein